MIIEKLQNITNLFICTIVSFNIIYYFVYEKYINFSVPFIFLHFTIDLFFCKNEIKVHHTLGIIIILFKYFYNVSTEDDSIIILSLYKTEISTFFYVFKYFLDQNEKIDNKIKILNNSLFFITFFKFRIFDYYINVISNPFIYSTLEKYTHNKILPNIFLYSGVYGFFILNTYWFIILCKIIFKPINNYFSKDKLIIFTHYSISYLYFLNLFSSIYIYSFQKDNSYILDIIGILILSYNNYIYHIGIIKYFKINNFIEYTSYEIMKIFVLDKISIHLRSFLCMVTSLYYKDKNYIILLSIINHINSIFNLIHYLCELKKNNLVIIYNDKDVKSKEFLKMTNIFITLPAIFDIFVISIFSNHFIYKIHNIFITIFLAFILYINPFYELNHLFFHLGLIVQNITLTMCNRI